MNVKRNRYEEDPDAQLAELKTASDNGHDSSVTRRAKAYMGRTTGQTADNGVRNLAEAVILQSIEDLWNPISKKGSLKFFEGNGFKLYSRVAGIRYIKQLAMLRMLADSGKKGH